MALEGSDWGIVAGVFVVIVVVLLWYNVRARASPAVPAPGGRDDTGDAGFDPLLLKFAHHEGSVVGETVAVDGERLILKQAGVFKAVPRGQARVEGGDVVLSGDIDWEAAIEGGTAWLEASRTGGSEEVAGDLTRSEDVKAPALEAFQKRQSESGEEE